MNYYLLGLYLGDGFISKDYQRKDGSIYYKFGVVTSQFNRAEVESLIPKVFSLKEVLSKDGKYTYCELFSKDQEFIKGILPYGMSSKDKIFPSNIPSIVDYWELISGLIDSDGTVSQDNVRFYNGNKSLIDGVSDSLNKLGIKTSVTFNESQGIYTVCISNTDINKTQLNLRVQYKQEQYLKLKAKSKGGWVEIDREFFEKHEEELKRVYSKAQFYRLKAGKTNKVRKDYYDLLSK